MLITELTFCTFLMHCVGLNVPEKRENRLRMFENEVLRRTF